MTVAFRKKWPEQAMKLFHLLCFNRTTRSIHDFIYRCLFYKEGETLLNYCAHVGEKKIIAISLGQLYFIEHIRDLFSWLQAHPGIAPLFLAPPDRIPRPRKIDFLDNLARRYNFVLGKNLFAHPWLPRAGVKAYLETVPTSYIVPSPAIKILYAHGLAGLSFSKDLKHIKLLDRYDILCLTGPFQRKALAAAQKMYGGKLPEMVEIGYMRGDRLLARQKDFNRSILFSKLGLEDAPTVLYAPTWGIFSSCSEWFDNIVRVCNAIGVNLLIRLHPIMSTGKTKWKTGGVNWNEKLDKVGAHKAVRVVLDHDIDNYLLASDTLITDVSGLGLEYMTLGKPVIFLPADRYFELYGQDRPEMWARNGSEIRSIEDLKKAILGVMKNPTLDFPIEQIVYNQGKSLPAMMNLLEQVTRLS